ncbi:MAG: DUF359 domain-containing protein [Promethearchaeati archaeon SRVP18_Atabeyarchaeia-1]
MQSRSDNKHKTAKLPDSLREELSKPRGKLVKGKQAEVSRRVFEFLENSKPSKIITVGDVVTRSMIDAGLRPDLSIVDGKTLRGPEESIDYPVDRTYPLVNPPGLITANAWKIIGKALKEKGKIKVVVDGEEDLLGILVVLLAPKGSLMLYGQPREGIVIVTVDEQARRFAKGILKQMEEQ